MADVSYWNDSYQGHIDELSNMHLDSADMSTIERAEAVLKKIKNTENSLKMEVRQLSDRSQRNAYDMSMKVKKAQVQDQEVG